MVGPVWAWPLLLEPQQLKTLVGAVKTLHQFQLRRLLLQQLPCRKEPKYLPTPPQKQVTLLMPCPSPFDEKPAPLVLRLVKYVMK